MCGQPCSDHQMASEVVSFMGSGVIRITLVSFIEEHFLNYQHYLSVRVKISLTTKFMHQGTTSFVTEASYVIQKLY